MRADLLEVKNEKKNRNALWFSCFVHHVLLPEVLEISRTTLWRKSLNFNHFPTSSKLVYNKLRSNSWMSQLEFPFSPANPYFGNDSSNVVSHYSMCVNVVFTLKRSFTNSFCGYWRQCFNDEVYILILKCRPYLINVIQLRARFSKPRVFPHSKVSCNSLCVIERSVVWLQASSTPRLKPFLIVVCLVITF